MIVKNFEYKSLLNGKVYKSQFTIKPFITIKDRANAQKMYTEATIGLEERTNFDTEKFAQLVNELPVDETIKQSVADLTASCIFPDSEMVTIYRILSKITQHIQSSTEDWWKVGSINNEIEDMDIVYSLGQMIAEVQDEVKKEQNPTEEAK